MSENYKINGEIYPKEIKRREYSTHEMLELKFRIRKTRVGTRKE